MKRTTWAAAVLLLALGCNSSALYFAKSAPDGEQGMRVELEGGTFSGGVNGRLEGVGEFVKIPNNYRGAVPEGWVLYEGGYPLQAVTPAPGKKPDEETATSPPADG